MRIICFSSFGFGDWFLYAFPTKAGRGIRVKKEKEAEDRKRKTKREESVRFARRSCATSEGGKKQSEESFERRAMMTASPCYLFLFLFLIFRPYSDSARFFCLAFFLKKVSEVSSFSKSF